MITRNQLHHLSGAYVLNALDEEERLAFEASLAEWDEMRSEVTELADTAAALGLALPPVAPGAGVRRELLAKVDAMEQLSSAAPPPSIVRPIRARTALPMLWFATAAALLLILVVSTSFLPGARTGAVTLAQLAAADDARSMPVAVEGADRVVLVWSDELNASALSWASLPPLDDGTVYGLWYLDGVPRPAGLVTSAASGTHVLEGTMRPGDRVAITIEPAGGSALPSAPPFAVVAPA